MANVMTGILTAFTFTKDPPTYGPHRPVMRERGICNYCFVGENINSLAQDLNPDPRLRASSLPSCQASRLDSHCRECPQGRPTVRKSQHQGKGLAPTCSSSGQSFLLFHPGAPGLPSPVPGVRPCPPRDGSRAQLQIKPYPSSWQTAAFNQNQQEWAALQTQPPERVGNMGRDLKENSKPGCSGHGLAHG